MPETLTGFLETITFHNAENDYTVARLRDSAQERVVTIVGHLSGVHEGENLRLSGAWKQHPRFGEQFEVESFEFIYPETEAGIERYLASGLISGIGPKTARSIVERFGRETLEVIEKRPQELLEITGLGQKKVARISQAWDQQRGIRRLMIFLQSYGISGALAARIYRRYRDRGVEAVSQNPYRLADEVRGIGFATADRIARSLGFPEDSPLRLESGLVHTGEFAAERGHTSLPRDKFLGYASRLLGCDSQRLEAHLASMVELGRLVADSQGTVSHIYTSYNWWAEQTVAQGIARLLEQRRLQLESQVDLAGEIDTQLDRFQSQAGIELSSEQKQAVAGALSEGMAVITGGPGTGKTTLIEALVRLVEGRGLKPVLAAPTGRAAKRMSESTSYPASTIHCLLGWSFTEGRFMHDGSRPLKGDVFVIDEVSMVDLQLFASLVDALPPGALLVLVGDMDQLPSIGPGKVLEDLIECGRVPTFRLTRIFRQAELSLIVRNAHRVRTGRLPEGAPPEPDGDGPGEAEPGGGDFFIVRNSDPARAREIVVRLAAERLKARFGLDPLEDLQVITPMNRGTCGTRELNTALQEALNPGGKKIPVAGGRFRVGDRVMQVRNDYEKDVFNGDIGRVAGFDTEMQTVAVDFDGRSVDYDAVELDDLAVAYAVTVHKSQGSEYPAVILTLLGEHNVMLQRNLLYTAISRGRRLVVIVGDSRAIERAVANDRVQFRYTRLAWRLKTILK
ncbi:MAG: ATP-dependent RecD-like DNA helicase, partial [Candidatus Glassbacteria bacterium]